jgi:hypothetical protein
LIELGREKKSVREWTRMNAKGKEKLARHGEQQAGFVALCGAVWVAPMRPNHSPCGTKETTLHFNDARHDNLTQKKQRERRHATLSLRAFAVSLLGASRGVKKMHAVTL